ncbi:hypothetical protein F2Q70_00007989 [Brassica cretica]|uniref:Sugar phosphate transporter domain-containing protein n=1 Tax=Brassica cretica TaxID=69181 RepID=A0A8S9M8M3_BRACR|nr:hypothetical protein F2Q70_00007989 [Brassica cretica]
MVLAAKQTLSAKIGFSAPLPRRNPYSSLQRLPLSLSFPSPALPKRTVLTLSKPLHLSSLRAKSPVRRSAYEADKSEPPQPIDDTNSEAAKKLKIGVYFATWWALNVVFNIYNKKVLNAYPYPWLTSTLSLAAGSLMMLISWAVGIVETPKTDFDFWKTLFPVAVAHTIGHVAATVSMSKVAVSFTHIIKSGEPAFSVLVSRFLLGETFPTSVAVAHTIGHVAATVSMSKVAVSFTHIIKSGEPAFSVLVSRFLLGETFPTSVYLSLIPIIGGCALSALTELNFNMIGFMGAMISNLAFVFRNIFSKKGMKGKSVSGMNYYACLSMLSLLILTPFAFAVEGPQMWIDGWQKALSDIGPQFVWWVAAQSVFYHLYNQVSYMSLDQISPLTFSVGNTMKRISVIVSSIIIFRTPVQPVNALGAAIAILGTFLYSQRLLASLLGLFIIIMNQYLKCHPHVTLSRFFARLAGKTLIGQCMECSGPMLNS